MTCPTSYRCLTWLLIAGFLLSGFSVQAQTNTQWTLQDAQDRLLRGEADVPRPWLEPTNQPPAGLAGVSLDTIYEALPFPATEPADVRDVQPEFVFWHVGTQAVLRAWGRQVGADAVPFEPHTGVLPAGYVTIVDLVRLQDIRSRSILDGEVVAGITGIGQLRGEEPLSPVPKTGMTTAYLDRPRADGDYQAGLAWPSNRFVVGEGSASNVVTDIMTGLMWWRNPPPAKRTWSNAVSFCEALDGSDGRGGYDDWRLPNIRELESILIYGQSSEPFIALPLTGDLVVFTGKAFDTWTSTPVHDVAGKVWVVDARSNGVTPRQMRQQSVESFVTYFHLAVRGP